MRYGIIGCGRIHRNHAQAAMSLPGVELVGVADVNSESLAKATSEWNVPGYLDFRDLVAAGVDAVGVCLPHHLHAPVCIELANLGVHILCEKPLATSLKDCDAIIEAAEKNNVKLGVAFQHRFNANVTALKQLLMSGRLGKPILGTALFQYYKNPNDSAYFEGSGWRGTWNREGGGVINTHAVHAVDLLCYFLGNVIAAKGLITALTHHQEVEDTGVGLFHFDSGAVGTAAASMSAGVKFESKITISGTEGIAVLTDSRRLEIEFLNGGQEKHIFDEPLDNPDFQTNLAYGRGHIAQLSDFAAAIRENRSPLSDGKSARNTFFAIDSLYDNAGRDSIKVKN